MQGESRGGGFTAMTELAVFGFLEAENEICSG
jgi:hypothetical protein